MNIAHLFTGWYVTPQGYPHILEEANRKATLNVIDQALKEGLDISFDVIPTASPYKFGGWQYLCAMFTEIYCGNDVLVYWHIYTPIFFQ